MSGSIRYNKFHKENINKENSSVFDPKFIKFGIPLHVQNRWHIFLNVPGLEQNIPIVSLEGPKTMKEVLDSLRRERPALSLARVSRLQNSSTGQNYQPNNLLQAGAVYTITNHRLQPLMSTQSLSKDLFERINVLVTQEEQAYKRCCLIRVHFINSNHSDNNVRSNNNGDGNNDNINKHNNPHTNNTNNETFHSNSSSFNSLLSSAFSSTSSTSSTSSISSISSTSSASSTSSTSSTSSISSISSISFISSTSSLSSSSTLLSSSKEFGSISLPSSFIKGKQYCRPKRQQSAPSSLTFSTITVEDPKGIYESESTSLYKEHQQRSVEQKIQTVSMNGEKRETVFDACCFNLMSIRHILQTPVAISTCCYFQYCSKKCIPVICPGCGQHPVSFISNPVLDQLIDTKLSHRFDESRVHLHGPKKANRKERRWPKGRH